MPIHVDQTKADLLALPQETTQGGMPLPFFLLQPQPMELFDPERHLPGSIHKKKEKGKQLPLAIAARQNKDIVLIPREEDCHALWDRYDMLDHIKEHSKCVADFALAIARLAGRHGVKVNEDAVYAAGLLHDLGKTYCIQQGGNHAQLGAAWTMSETRNGHVAQAVYYHVHWMWEESLVSCLFNDALFCVMALIYADKRVMHNAYVSLDERFDDLKNRYGKTEQARQRILASKRQGETIEAVFSQRFGVSFDEHTIDNGRLVHRA